MPEWEKAVCSCDAFRRWAQCAAEIATSRFAPHGDCHFLPQWSIAKHATRVHRFEDGIESVLASEVSKALESGWVAPEGAAIRDVLGGKHGMQAGGLREVGAMTSGGDGGASTMSTVAMRYRTQLALDCPKSGAQAVDRSCFDAATYEAAHRLFSDDFDNLGYDKVQA